MDPKVLLKKENLLLLFFGGLLLVVLAIPTSKEENKEKTQVQTAVQTKDTLSVLEEELGALLSKVQGAGACEAMLMGKVLSDGSVQVDGVVVLSSGAGNAEVSLALTEAVRALFGIDAHKVKILAQSGK